jgi:hypothetical protein
MKKQPLLGLLAAGLVLGCPLPALAENTSTSQSTGSVTQDVQKAGGAIKDGAVSFGHGVKQAASEVANGATELWHQGKKGAISVGHTVADTASGVSHSVHDSLVRDDAPAPIEPHSSK